MGFRGSRRSAKVRYRINLGQLCCEMKSIVVLAPHPQFSEEVRAVSEPLEFRVIHRITVEEAEPLLTRGLASVCILDLELARGQAVWMVERILRRAPRCTIIAFSSSRDPEWEEELYLAGAKYVFGKPLQSRLLAQTLKGLVQTDPHSETLPHPLAVAPSSQTVQRAVGEEDPKVEDHGLSALRRFSDILTHSLDADALLRQLLSLLRETLGVNRSAIFLKTSSPVLGADESGETEARMKAVCAVGLPPALIEHCVLSPESGIGAYLLGTGRVLRRYTPEALETMTQREFEMIGAEVAVPIMGQEGMIGVAVFDSRVTGKPLTDGELESIFHLLEQVGLAISNIWAHDQLVGSNQLLGDALRELSNACVVVGTDLSVLHANKAARRIVGGSARRSATMHFGDFPEVLGASMYQVIKTGAALPTFRYEADNASHSVYSVSVVPIRSSGDPTSPSGSSALMVMEDRTQAEQLQQLEVESANLRLMNKMADRLAAEIGNAIVPLSVHQQLFDQRIKESEFRKSLKVALADGVKRVDRLANQMRFIYGDSANKTEVIPLGELLDEANKDANEYFPAKSASLDCGPDVRSATVSGSRGALRHTFSEIILNGYQANAVDAKVRVRLVEGGKSNGIEEIGIEFEDSGEGFSKESAKQAAVPFYTNRTVGVGLGLSAVRKIVEDHGGRLEIPTAQQGKRGLVRVFLPGLQAQE